MWTACTSSGHIVTARSLASQSSADWPHKGAELLACTGLTAWEVSPERLLGRLLMREGSVCRGFAMPRLTRSSERNYSSFGKGSRGSRAEDEAAASAGVVGQLEWARTYEDHLGRFEYVAGETGREALILVEVELSAVLDAEMVVAWRAVEAANWGGAAGVGTMHH